MRALLACLEVAADDGDLIPCVLLLASVGLVVVGALLT